MALYIDVGNTALKWRWRHGADVRQGGGSHQRDWAAMAQALAAEMAVAPGQIWVASVAGREADADLAAALQAAFDVVPAFYYSRSGHLGISNSYAQPERLGVDRWLAMLEGWHQVGANIVVDCGSALTLDAVDGAGTHLGGYIVPGLSMLERSLLSSTGSVRFESPMQWHSLDPGGSTVDCVHNGVIRMTVAFVTDAVVALQEAVQDTCTVFLTGGDAERVGRWLGFPVEVAPDLVLDGLERVARAATQGETG
ncbi:MAG: type III pantothenate kinase [Alcanivoracaceae bacterium]|nr:type III pantothenate kinase [Alcanivoracaceae bacterium]